MRCVMCDDMRWVMFDAMRWVMRCENMCDVEYIGSRNFQFSILNYLRSFNNNKQQQHLLANIAQY